MNNSFQSVQGAEEAMLFFIECNEDFLPFVDIESDDSLFLNKTIETISEYEYTNRMDISNNSVIILTDDYADDDVIPISVSEYYGFASDDDDVIPLTANEYYGSYIFAKDDDDVIPITTDEYYGFEESDFIKIDDNIQNVIINSDHEEELRKAVNSILTP
jgi:hypothetical protein